MKKPVRILIADDHVSIRTALRELLDLVTGIEVVGEATTGTEAVSPPTPVTEAVAVNAVPRYVYGEISKVTTVVEVALVIVIAASPAVAL